MLKKTFLAIINFYIKFISPLKRNPTCRFRPTCSEYVYQAVNKYGIFKGTFLGIKRILRCHPFHLGGHDPVK